MRRVTKAKAAALKVEGKTPAKRKATKNVSLAEEDSEEEVVQKEEGRAVSSVPKNGQSSSAGADESDEAESFEVESILSSRVRHGKQQFKIRWKGYGPADDTWEDEENVDSPDLIAAFLRSSPKNAAVLKKPPKKTGKQGKKRSKSASPQSSPAKKVKTPTEADGDDNTEYEVSKIIDYVELKDGTRQFLVRWKGFSAKDNTWEPESNLNCPSLIEKFLQNEKQKEDSTRETRTERQQVHKYSPELTKRSCHRLSAKKRISYHDLE